MEAGPIPDQGGTGLLVMPVRRRTRRRSKVWPLEEKEKVDTTKAGPSKSMEVVLSSPGQGRKREVVMVTDVVTRRQSIKMRIADGRSGKEKHVSPNVSGGADGWEKEDLHETGAEGQAETPQTPRSKDKAQ